MDFITYQTLAGLSGEKVETLRVWVHRGKMPAPDTHVGSTAVWFPETIGDWIEENRLVSA